MLKLNSLVGAPDSGYYMLVAEITGKSANLTNAAVYHGVGQNGEARSIKAWTAGKDACE